MTGQRDTGTGFPFFRSLKPWAVFLATVTFFTGGLHGIHSQERGNRVRIARIRYDGGGDWYNDPSAIPNLCRYMNRHAGLDLAEEEARISLTDESLFQFPILFMTGHGRIRVSETEAERLRTHLLNGGFLYADDDYGMDAAFRQLMEQVFPDRSLVELPFEYGIYHIHFSFPSGLPKIHEHDNKPPGGYGIFDDQQRLMVFYTVESNLSDGWADPEVHNDPPEKRDAAFRMGTNIMIWALLGSPERP